MNFSAPKADALLSAIEDFVNDRIEQQRCGESCDPTARERLREVLVELTGKDRNYERPFQKLLLYVRSSASKPCEQGSSS